MPSGTHITETYAAIEALLKSQQALSGVTVRGLTGGDFEAETARLIVKPPAVLLAFTGERLVPRHPHSVTYHSTQSFQVICGARSLRGTQQERIGALDLLSNVSNALAGAKLALPASPQQKALVSLRAVTLGQLDDDGTWYTIDAEVWSVALFEEKA